MGQSQDRENNEETTKKQQTNVNCFFLQLSHLLALILCNNHTCKKQEPYYNYLNNRHSVNPGFYSFIFIN